MVDKHRLVDWILLVIFTISFLSSLGLSINGSSKFCLTPTSCDIVSTSKYAFTFGIKNSYYGVVIFAIMSIIAAWHIYEPHHHKNKFIKAGVVFGSLVAAYFIFLQVFIIQAFCTYCLIIDIGLLLALLLVFIHEGVRPTMERFLNFLANPLK